MKGEESILINGVPDNSVHALDRGLQYGDGIFRTLKVVSGQVRWWHDHYLKLVEDCEALAIQSPIELLIKSEVDHVASLPDIGVVKIIITRGMGQRGYRTPLDTEPTRIVMGYRANHTDTASVHVRWCELRLPHQPLLAGIKHLNRLENVLAQSEWNTPDIAEGLLRDTAGHVICGTMTNLFIVERNKLITPDLSQCGVAGVTRKRLMQAARKHGQPVQIDTISPQRLLAADQILLCNSLIEIWWIENLAVHTWSDTGWANKLKCWINEDI